MKITNAMQYNIKYLKTSEILENDIEALSHSTTRPDRDVCTAHQSSEAVVIHPAACLLPHNTDTLTLRVRLPHWSPAKEPSGCCSWDTYCATNPAVSPSSSRRSSSARICSAERV